MTVSPPRYRLFVEDDLSAGASISLGGPRAHYLLHVLRLRVGESIALFNGRDGEWRADIVDARKANCRVTIAGQSRSQAMGPDLWLMFAPLKKAKTDLIVEKATELGVSELRPVMTERTNTERVNVARLSSIAIEAAEQCGRLTVPTVSKAESLTDAIGVWSSARRLFMLDESGAGQPISTAMTSHIHVPAALLIGPEGGFAPSEAEALRARPFVTAVSLGRRILRAETAAIAALACWQALAGDWR
ncbi:MAG: 16S rRNA (uracil(1498)-N(3))-methyltransferase [Alphaproteobacteria bacterium]|nr:16S rRNA (uracil(1498)-N(3))-methyltransferase [Alphaproteobacteria bacterium]